MLGSKIMNTHHLGQKAMRVAKKAGKVATGAGVVGTAIMAVKTGASIAGDSNVRQVGRMLAPGVSALVNTAMR